MLRKYTFVPPNSSAGTKHCRCTRESVTVMLVWCDDKIKEMLPFCKECFDALFLAVVKEGRAITRNVFEIDNSTLVSPPDPE